jgi:hypothetical protein
MPPARALSAADHDVFGETFSFASMTACGKTLLGGTAARVAAATLAVSVGAAAALPGARHVEATPAVSVVASPVTFVRTRAEAPAVRAPRHPSPRAAAIARPATPNTARPVHETSPPPVRSPALAAPRALTRPTTPAPKAAPAPVSLPEPPAPPAAPPAPEPPPVEAPHPVVPPLPPLPPVTDPALPNVDLPSLPLGP